MDVTTLARRAAFALATLVVAALALAARADGFVYWANNDGTIQSATLNGTPANSNLVSSQGKGRGVAVDDTYIYWPNYDTNTIGRADKLDGSGVNQSFITGAFAPSGVAVDASDGSNRHIYWANSNGTIGRADLDSNGNPSNVVQNFVTGAGLPQGITVDDTYVYWAGHASIGRANKLDGSGVNQRFISGVRPGVDIVLGVAVDSTGGHIYWSNFYSSTIGQGLLNGSVNNQNLITGAAEPVGLAVDSAHLYWANFRGNIGRASLDGTGADENFARADAPEAVAVDALAGSCAGREATIVGTGRSDRLRGTNRDDVIAAKGGKDRVTGLGGDDLICGGAGDDVLRGNGGDDRLRGGRGSDKLRGGRGSDRCRGGGGADSLHSC